MDNDGHVITNHHVVAGSTRMTLVLPDNSTVQGRVIGSDEERDIAVVEVTGLSLPAAEFGSSRNVRIGEQVIAVGSPGSLSPSMLQRRLRSEASRDEADPCVVTGAVTKPATESFFPYSKRAS